jgi:hypothetical protein
MSNVPIPGNKPDADDSTAKKRAEIKKIIDGVDWHMSAELYNLQAKMYMLKYKACLRQGFSTDQSLDLCHKEWK